MQVFILSRNRPIYLWNCLDSLYRLTRSEAEFHLVDSASDDPLVARVIDGFHRRDFFHSTVMLDRNEAALVQSTIAARVDPRAEFFAFIESDVVVLPGAYACWIAQMRLRMEADPKLALLGSFEELSDLVPMPIARRLHPEQSEEDLLILTHNKYARPEAYAGIDLSAPTISPHNPPGRLLMMRREAVMRVGAASDSDLNDRLLQFGYRTAISTEVRHRHLSLCNILDYPDYEASSRNRFMYSYSYKSQVEAAVARGEVRLVDECDLHLLADGARIEAMRDGPDLVFTVPDGAAASVLASRRGFAFGTPDLRPLGVAVSSLVIDGTERLADLDARLGWYALEDGWRWTTGQAELPPGRQVRVRFRTSDLVRYPG